VAPLDAALALTERGDGAAAVADDLHLDVAGVADQLLDEDLVAAERGARLRAAARIGFRERVCVLHQAHAAPAAAGHRLDDDRAGGAKPGQESARILKTRGSGGSAQHRNAASFRQRAGLQLIAQQFQHRSRRADEADAGRGTIARECRVLAEEAVAGMHRVTSRFARNGDDLHAVQIGGRAAAVQCNHGIRLAHMQ
jgi:hypothetical protein